MKGVGGGGSPALLGNCDTRPNCAFGRILWFFGRTFICVLLSLLLLLLVWNKSFASPEIVRQAAQISNEWQKYLRIAASNDL